SAPRFENPRTLTLLEDLEDRLSSLKSATSTQEWLQSQALQIVGDVETVRWALAQESSSLIPLPLLGAMLIWLAVIFVSFGLFAPRNATTIVALFFTAFAMAAAVKVTIDMETLQGRVHLSSAALRHAVEEINH